MTEIGIFELVVVLVQSVLLGVWGTLLWAELRHKIKTEWGRWGVLMLCWVLTGLMMCFG